MSLLESFAAAAVTIFAVALLAIALLAYRRGREGGLLFLAAAFALFAIKGVLLTAFTLTGEPSLGTYVAVGSLLDVAVLALMYAMTLRR